MTLREEMTGAARRGAAALGPAAADAAAFVASRRGPNGGWTGRSEEDDLYYGVFATAALAALGQDACDPELRAWLATAPEPDALDLVHLSSLIRCRATACPEQLDDAFRTAALARVRAFRSADDGYALDPDGRSGSAYGAFLAIGALQDLDAAPEDPDAMAGALAALRPSAGGYCNEAAVPAPSAPATAAAVTVLHQLGRPTDDAALRWLRQACYRGGGFTVVPALPVPDLLSTAVTVHALATRGFPLGDIAGEVREFVMARRTPAGGFCASAADTEPDVEYTFYGLMALGHVAAEGGG